MRCVAMIYSHYSGEENQVAVNFRLIILWYDSKVSRVFSCVDHIVSVDSSSSSRARSLTPRLWNIPMRQSVHSMLLMASSITLGVHSSVVIGVLDIP